MLGINERICKECLDEIEIHYDKLSHVERCSACGAVVEKEKEESV